MTITDNTITISVPFENLEDGAIFKNANGEICMKIPEIRDEDLWKINVLHLTDYTYDAIDFCTQVTPLKGELIINF